MISTSEINTAVTESTKAVVSATESTTDMLGNMENIAMEAAENKNVARPFAIYADDKLVGFTMFAFDVDYDDPNDRYWLWRFMIDKNLQGKGYGSAALEKMIEYFKNNGADHIRLSTKDTNTVALSLYHKYQFKGTGEMNGEEMILELKL